MNTGKPKIPPFILVWFFTCSLNRLKSYTIDSKQLHTLRNPMMTMYTSPKFESEKAARNHVERLQNDQRVLAGHRNWKSNVQQESVATDLKHIWVKLLESSYRQWYQAFNRFTHKPGYFKFMVSSRFATSNRILSTVFYWLFQIASETRYPVPIVLKP